MKKMMSTCIALICAIGAFVSLRWLTKSREDTDWRDASKPGKLLEVDGVGLHFIEAGSGPPIVMIHGFGGQTFSFRYQMEAFAQDHRCVAIDLKGFGYSERPDGGDYSLLSKRASLARWTNCASTRPSSLATPWGRGRRRAAELAPDRVEKLVLVATAPGYPLWIGPRCPGGKMFLRAFARLARATHARTCFTTRSPLTSIPSSPNTRSRRTFTVR